MSCPGCGAPIGRSDERCLACGAVIAPPVQGALAPDPLSLTAAPPGKVAPLREIPGMRKRERTWKDEVRERVRDRRRERAGQAGLPLFPEGEVAADDPAAVAGSRAATQDAEPSWASLPAPSREPLPAGAFEAHEGRGIASGPALLDREPIPAAPGPAVLDAEDRVDLPLRPTESLVIDGGSEEPLEAAWREEPRRSFRVEPVPSPAPAAPLAQSRETPPHDASDSDASPPREWRLDLAEPEPPERPVERPAQAVERAQAAAVDLALLLGSWAIVLYFTSRAAHVTVAGLAPTWPWLAGYLAALGLAYAAYFTGTTGQTLGKMLGGLRVVDSSGRPPGHFRALVRAAFGTVGVALGFLGVLPLFLDPARRALHDRLVRTRVVKQ